MKKLDPFITVIAMEDYDQVIFMFTYPSMVLIESIYHTELAA
ncbi:MAG: hypothetical protein ACTHME_08940 [Candidatus Nitrosocosmicus sp.]